MISLNSDRVLKSSKHFYTATSTNISTTRKFLLQEVDAEILNSGFIILTLPTIYKQEFMQQEKPETIDFSEFVSKTPPKKYEASYDIFAFIESMG